MRIKICISVRSQIIANCPVMINLKKRLKMSSVPDKNIVDDDDGFLDVHVSIT